MDNNFGEAHLLEPIYRMIKVVQNYDDKDAKVVASLAVQYISDNYKDKALSRMDVQEILRMVLVYYKEGFYYSRYLANELQVATAQWVTVLAADLPLTIGQIGQVADDLAKWLEDKDALELKAAEVLSWFKEACGFDPEMKKRIEINERYYLDELMLLLNK